MNIDQILGKSGPPKPSMLHATMRASGSPQQAALGWLFRDPAMPFPRTPVEWLVAAVYLLPILSAAQLVVSTPGAGPAPPLALLVAGLLIGLIGLAYPTRRLIAVVLCLYWLWVLVFAIQRFGDGLLALPIVIVSGGFLFLCDWVERRRQRETNVALSDATNAAFLSPRMTPRRRTGLCHAARRTCWKFLMSTGTRVRRSNRSMTSSNSSLTSEAT